MVLKTTAIYENGAFRPLGPPPDIPEHSTVEISIQTAPSLSKEEQLRRLAGGRQSGELADAIEDGRKRAWPVEEF